MARSYVIQCVRLEGGIISLPSNPRTPTGQFLKVYDPEAHQGRGWVEWTADIRLALKFRDPTTAMEVWRMQPRCKPFREDGRPNRPLCAYTIEVVPV